MSSDPLQLAKWIIIGGAGVFICAYVYKNLNQFLDLEIPDKIEQKPVEMKPKIKPIAPSQTTDEQKEDLYSKDKFGSKFPVQVFVRIRPLVGNEVLEKHESLQYSVKKSKKSGTQTLTLQGVVGGGAKKRDRKFTSFQSIVLPDSDNVATFNTCLLPAIESVFEGDKVCIFAYGHTGSGKTHTIFGYEKENVAGMFQLFARSLLSDTRFKENKDLFVEIRFTELYQKKIRDLLSEDKAECFVREDENGDIKLRANPKHCDDGKIRAYPITGMRVQSEQELLNIIRDAVKSRNVGKSTLHDKSSRSHAFLEYEIVSNALVAERERLMEKEADILLLQTQIEIMRQKTYRGHLESFQEKLKLIEGMDDRKFYQYQQDVVTMQSEEKEIQAAIQKLTNDPQRPYVGGTMVFVDLAGNEYGRDLDATHKADAEEERERNEINKSLLALKECIRALHNKRDYVGYRGSKLTMYLRRYLRGHTSRAIMISNVGSSQRYVKQTVNTLQYSQLVAKA